MIFTYQVHCKLLLPILGLWRIWTHAQMLRTCVCVQWWGCRHLAVSEVWLVILCPPTVPPDDHDTDQHGTVPQSQPSAQDNSYSEKWEKIIAIQDISSTAKCHISVISLHIGVVYINNACLLTKHFSLYSSPHQNPLAPHAHHWLMSSNSHKTPLYTNCQCRECAGSCLVREVS